MSVPCQSPAVAPPDPVRFTANLSYDPVIRIAEGDRLEIWLKRDMEGGGIASSDIVLNLAPGAMPAQAFADLRPPLLPADLRADAMFALSARIVGADGFVKAVSDRDLGRPHAPYLTSATAVSTVVRMLPADAAADRAASAAQMATQAAGAALPPATLARFQRASATDYRTYCASADPAEDGFCAGVMFSHLARAPGNGLCVPEAGGNAHARLTGFVAGGKAQIARITPRRDEGAYEYSERALKAAFPCQSATRSVADQPAVEARTYQARFSITENGKVIAASRVRVLPDDNAMGVLNADGREYQFDLSLDGPGNDPEGRGRLTVRADVARVALAGGWEPLAQPVVLMNPDGPARMSWTDAAGLLFDIVVEPA